MTHARAWMTGPERQCVSCWASRKTAWTAMPTTAWTLPASFQHGL